MRAKPKKPFPFVPAKPPVPPKGKKVAPDAKMEAMGKKPAKMMPKRGKK